MADAEVFVKQIAVGAMANFAYLVGDATSRQVMAVDPAWEPGRILAEAEAEGVRICGLLLTHNHYDHANTAQALVKELGVPVHVHKKEAALPGVDPGKIVAGEAEDIVCGGIRIGAIPTPGHSPGSRCYLAGGYLFTGDTLFVGACGRCDLAGGSVRELFKSLHERLARLPDETVVLPGHDYGDTPRSTLGRERRSNPYLLCRSMDDFLAERM